MLNRSRLAVCVGAALAAMGSVGVNAQEVQKLERVEVTGTRIKTLNTTSNSPTLSVGKDDINSSAPMAVEEVVRSLSAAYPGVGPGTNNGSGGIATIDLRGLGPQRTLVLINGRRMVPSDLNARVDTNAVPVALLERVDLVTGGASAVYGADAVAGVVNFVTRKNFSGLDAQTSYGVNERGDGTRVKTDFALGVNSADKRGNLVLAVGSTRTDPLTQGEREIGKVQINSNDGSVGGSPNAVPPTFGGFPTTGAAPLPGDRVFDAATGKLIPYVPTRDDFNFNPLNYFETPLKRTQFTAMGNYKINDSAEAYAELFHTKNKVVLNLAPSGSFGAAFNVPIGNPYIPDAMRSELCAAYGIAAADCVAGNAQQVRFNIRRRFVELGPRINDFDNTLSQWTVGLRGDAPLLDGWSYDAYLQRGTTDQVSSRVNWGSRSKVEQALNATNTTTCAVNANGCVPLNAFGGAGTITPAMLNFINLSSVQSTAVKQSVAAVTLSGDVGVLQSPWAKAPLGMALGVEARDISASNRSDGPSQIAGEVLGTGAPLPDRSGTIKLKEAYLEAVMPLAERLPNAHALNLELGYRQTNFKTEAASKDYGSWKYGLDWSPVKGLRFRGMQQRATRAPNINELYAPVVTGLSNSADPCAGTAIKAEDAGKAGTLTNLCQLTGVPTGQIGFLSPPAAGQVNTTSGGNLALGPEEANTKTLGLVWEPESIPGLGVTLDYYRIDVNKAISSATVPQTVQGCYSAALNPGFVVNTLCGNIARDPTTGSLNVGTGISTQSSNFGRYSVSGLDFGASYRLPLSTLGLKDAGRVDFALQVSLMDKWDFQSLPTLATINCAGYYSVNCGNPYPKTKFTQRATWVMGDFTAGYNWRYIGRVSEEPGAPNFLPAFSKIKAYNYLDLNASWTATKNIKLSLAVNNVLDKEAPMVGNTIGGTGPNSGNTFPQTYDVLGRRYTVTVQAMF